MMHYIKRFSLIGLLVGAFLIAVQAPALAKATGTDVTGVSDTLEGMIGGDVVVDGNGKLHFKKAAFAGDFAVQGDGVDIQGRQVLALTGVVDETFSGPLAGSFEVTKDISGVETLIWEGSVHGHLDQLSFTGQVVADGKGPYAGLKLKLQMQEIPGTPDNPNPEVFDVTGSILDPHGSE